MYQMHTFLKGNLKGALYLIWQRSQSVIIVIFC